MRFDEVIEHVTSSSPKDWNTIACWGAFSGPSYRNQFVFWNVYEGDKNVLEVDSHSNVGVFMPDVSITLSWGLKCNEDFKEEWANGFPDSKASSSYIDIFYNGSLVFRDVYVTVDGGRAKLPLPSINREKSAPEIANLTVPRKYRDLIKLIDSLEYISEFDRYFRQAGFTTVEEDWPHTL